MRLVRRPSREEAQQDRGRHRYGHYATEKAKIAFPEGVSTDDLVTAVQNAGYTATLPTPPSATSPAPPTIRVIANSPRYAPV